MSMKKYALYAGAIMMAMGAGEKYTTGGRYIKPSEIKLKPGKSQKQGQKKWRVNNVVVEAATKNAAIKKARKNPDYIERQGPPDAQLHRWEE